LCLLIVLSTRFRHPTSSTLSPYTTLFRSETVRAVSTTIGSEEIRAVIINRIDFLEGDELFNLYCMCGFDRKLFQFFFREENILSDRKSTRLNSSHVKISYAVLCLKKKMKN